MTSDLLSVTRTTTGTAVSGPARLRAIYYVAGATAGDIVLRDGGASGTTIADVDTPASATVTQFIEVPGNGLRFATDVHVTITNATSVTLFYS